MGLTKTETHPVTPHSLQGRTAASMYLAAMEGEVKFVRYLDLPTADRQRYERMAAAALSVAYSEPVTV